MFNIVFVFYNIIPNFSIFQSVPDAWGIGQIMPVVPIHRHLEVPTMQGTIADITCDSDGKLDKFLGDHGKTGSLPFHGWNGKEYHIGIFLTGAYQDIMGDMHNLFGRPTEVHVFCDDDDPSDFYIEEVIHGNSSAEVLEIMQYNSEEMCRKIKSGIDSKIKAGEIKPRNGVKLTDFYEACLHSYTYLS